MKQFRTCRTRIGQGVLLLLLAAMLGAFVAFAGAGQAEAAVPATGVTSQHQPVTPTPTPKGIAQNQAGQPPTDGCNTGIGPAQVNVCKQVTDVLTLGILYPLWKASMEMVDQALGTLYSTDPRMTYANPDVVSLTGYTQDAVDVFLLLVVLVTGIRLVWEQNIFSWADFRETLPQVLMAFFLARVSLNLAGAVINLNNALIVLFLPGIQSAFSTFVPTTINLLDLPTTLLDAFLGILLALLIIEAGVRIPVLGVLMILSPAGCFALAWKPTQRFGLLWLNAFIAAVFVQFLQLLLLTVGLVLIKSVYPPKHVTYLGLIGGIALMITTLTLPFAAYRWAIQPVASSAKSTVESVAAAGKAAGMAAAGL
jgi:hypothetical protein